MLLLRLLLHKQKHRKEIANGKPKLPTRATLLTWIKIFTARRALQLSMVMQPVAVSDDNLGLGLRRNRHPEPGSARTSSRWWWWNGALSALPAFTLALTFFLLVCPPWLKFILICCCCSLPCCCGLAWCFLFFPHSLYTFLLLAFAATR